MLVQTDAQQPARDRTSYRPLLQPTLGLVRAHASPPFSQTRSEPLRMCEELGIGPSPWDQKQWPLLVCLVLCTFTDIKSAKPHRQTLSSSQQLLPGLHSYCSSYDRAKQVVRYTATVHLLNSKDSISNCTVVPPTIINQSTTSSPASSMSASNQTNLSSSASPSPRPDPARANATNLDSSTSEYHSQQVSPISSGHHGQLLARTKQKLIPSSTDNQSSSRSPAVERCQSPELAG
jgi:hypothetical protein